MTYKNFTFSNNWYICLLIFFNLLTNIPIYKPQINKPRFFNK